MKSAGPAPTPDPNIGIAAKKQAETGEAWLSFAKDAFAVSNERQAELDALTKQVTEQQLGLAQDQMQWSREDRERYNTVFKPVEDQFVEEANSYATPERQAQAAAEAKADVAAAAAVAKGTAEREAAALGINPASGRHAGIQRSGELGTALATAGAANMARQGIRDKGLALKADVVNLGRGLPAQAAQAASVGLGAGSTAVGLHQNNQQLSNQAGGIVHTGFGGAMSGYQGQANTLQNLHNSEISIWNSKNQMAAANAAGIGQAIGGIAGLFFSDEDLKEDKQPIPDGDALEAVKAMPVESWKYKDGVADEEHHVGPYAQDFAEQTGKGDGHMIAAQDAIGITMKAVQDLDQKVDRIAEAVGLGGVNRPKAAAKGKRRAAPDQQPPMQATAEVVPMPEAAHAAPPPANPDEMPGLGLRRAA